MVWRGKGDCGKIRALDKWTIIARRAAVALFLSPFLAAGAVLSEVFELMMKAG